MGTKEGSFRIGMKLLWPVAFAPEEEHPFGAARAIMGPGQHDSIFDFVHLHDKGCIEKAHRSLQYISNATILLLNNAFSYAPDSDGLNL